ncbi:MAG: hypothetical protein AB8F95_06065 [Bacteroidia bacterium]
MSSPMLKQVAEGVYLAADAAADQAVKVIFWLPEGGHPQDISLKIAWGGGQPVVIMADVEHDQIEALIAQVATLTARPEHRGTRFLWIQNPEDPWTNWELQAIVMEGKQLNYPVALTMRNYGLHLPAATAVSADDKGIIFIPQHPITKAYCSTGYGKSQLESEVSSVRLNLDGCLLFNLKIEQDSSADLIQYPDLTLLDQGFRLSYPDPDFPAEKGRTVWLSQRYPLFMEKSDQVNAFSFYPTNILCAASWDLIHPLKHDRSFYHITGKKGLSEVSIPSGFRSTMGYHVHLKAKDAGSKLVFLEKPGGLNSENRSALYLSPEGDFIKSIPRYTDSKSAGTVRSGDQMMAGLSGIEAFEVRPVSASYLRFVPDQPGAMPGFRPASPDEAASAKGGRDGLSPQYLTSWCYLYQEDGLGSIYYAQPEGASLYKPETGFKQVLIHLPTPAAALPGPTGSSFAPFPMLPHGAVDARWLANYKFIESDILAPIRQRTILKINDLSKSLAPAVSAPLGPNIEAASPQGIVVNIKQDHSEWEKVQLARGTEETGKPFGVPFGLNGLKRDKALRRAFHNNQLFVVITNPEALTNIFSEDELRIQGWTFDLDPQRWKQRGTFFILKYRPGPMRALVDNLSVWTEADACNERPTSAQRRLGHLLDDMIALGTGGETAAMEKYRTVARAATLDGWTGILGLNVHAPLSGLPDELLALGAGIDQSKFYAQYVGVENTPVWVDDLNKLVSGPSALFGLLDYKNDQRPPSDESGYNFAVTRLSVRFAQSRVQDFAADIVITLDKFFGEKTTLKDSETGRNDLWLKGSAETHNGKTTYAFSFVGKNRFLLNGSAAMRHVDIIKASFLTDPIEGSRDSNPTIIGRFAFWGLMDFRELNVDVLGFGANDITQESDPHFLTFGNLQVTMSFPLDTPAARTFRFISDKLSFDMKTSKARETSLTARFPLGMNGLIHEKAGGRKPGELGFLPVRTTIKKAKLEQEWYGLEFSLKLGSLGALAGGAAIVSHILLAWEPDGDGLFVGLRLPGTNGVRAFKLQGILELTFKQIMLQAVQDGNKTAYTLKLKNIVLKFFNIPLPPSAKTELSLFSNPDHNADDKVLGWYAAFAK